MGCNSTPSPHLYSISPEDAAFSSSHSTTFLEQNQPHSSSTALVPNPHILCFLGVVEVSSLAVSLSCMFVHQCSNVSDADRFLKVNIVAQTEYFKMLSCDFLRLCTQRNSIPTFYGCDNGTSPIPFGIELPSRYVVARSAGVDALGIFVILTLPSCVSF